MADAIYAFQSTNEYLLRKAIDARVEKLGVDSFNFMRYDLLEVTSDDVLEDLQTISFFSELKVIVVRHIEVILDASSGIINAWVKYFEKPNPDVILMLELSESIPSSTPIGEAINKYAYIEEIKDPKQEEYPAFVKDLFKSDGYQITDEAINALLVRTNYEFTLLNREAEKLELYKVDDKIIKEIDVMKLVSRNLEEHIYELTNALLSNNMAKTIEIYHDLMARNEDPLRVLNFIVNKMRELMHVKLLVNKGLRQDEIANHFHISNGRAYYMVKNAKDIASDLIEHHLQKLGQLDFDIKSGRIDKKLGVELYLLGV